MSQPIWLDCPSLSAFPSADRLRELVSDDYHVVLRFPAEEPGAAKASVVEQLASALPECSVFDSGAGWITVKKVIRAEAVVANTTAFVAAARLFRQTASALASRLARRLRVEPDRLLDLGRNRDSGSWLSCLQGLLGLPRRTSLDRVWDYAFHGLECRFENRVTGQVVEVRLGFGGEFGVLDPYFFTLFVKSTPGLAHLARLLRDDFHDAARVLKILYGAGYLRVVEDRFGRGLVLRDEGDSMTSAEWNSATDSSAMLEVLRNRGSGSGRKLRLFVAACARSLRPVFGGRQEAVAAVYERLADGQASEEDLIRVLSGDMFDLLYPDGVPPTPTLQSVWESARTAAKTATHFTHLDTRDNTEEEKASICNLLRDIFGNPCRLPPSIDAAWLAWHGGMVRRLAEAIYEERDFERMGVLGDALEEVGCDNDELLTHCRQQGAVHVRGCWVVDVLLGKS
jgi:hypothetical protein